MTKKDLRLDLIPRIKNMVSEENPWKDMSADQILKSARLLGVDAATGKRGFKAAAILLLGSDDVIGDIFPAYKTDALLQKVNVDRYDDRDIVQTNLIESYDRLQAFGIKHLMDKFFLEDGLRVSLRGKILREMLVNVLVHREFTSSRPARFIIRRDEMFTDNANKALHYGVITPRNLEPEPKNPIIANFFHQIQLADELGSGVRNLYKYVRIYSGALPIFDEGDIFRLTVPLNAEHSPEATDTPNSTRKTTEKGGKKTVEKTVEKTVVETVEKTVEKILKFLEANPSATQEEIVSVTGLSRRGVEWNLKELKKSGRIRRVGPDKGGHWEVIG